VNKILNVPRSEAVALVQSAVELAEGGISAANAILLKRQAEQAPYLAFGQNDTFYAGNRCACPAVRAGIAVTTPESDGGRFADAFDQLVCDAYGLDNRFDMGVLVIA
jgi:hypothetical protein